MLKSDLAGDAGSLRLYGRHRRAGHHRRVAGRVRALADAAGQIYASDSIARRNGHAVSDRRDYSVRASKIAEDELGLLTDGVQPTCSAIEGTECRAGAARAGRTAELEAANAELRLFALGRRTIFERLCADHRLHGCVAGERTDELRRPRNAMYT